MGVQKGMHRGRQSQPQALASRREKARQQGQAELLERERQSVRVDGEEKLPHAHLPTPARGARGQGLAEGGQNDQCVSVPGQGLNSDISKNESSHEQERASSPGLEAGPQVWEAGLRNNRR